MARKEIDPSEIHKAGVQRALEPRREPYWQRVQRGQYVGYRKLESGSETWIARYRQEDRKQKYHSLGVVSETLDFDAAKAAAIEWFKLQEHGIKTDEIITVADACRRYVDERRTSKSQACAHDAQKRFERTVYDNPIGALALAKLRTAHIKTWRDGLGLRPATINRTLTALKAALNLAVAEDNVIPSQAHQWAKMKPLPNADKRRDLFLDLDQRQALLAATSDEQFQKEYGKAVRDLIEGAALTGARAGELVGARRSQFDARTGEMTFISAKGNAGPRERKVLLTPAAMALFSRLSRGKLPGAFLFTRDDGKPWAHSDWDELVRAAARKAELPAGTCLYTLRHSFITAQLTEGTPTLEVARFVGTSLVMIEKHYGHVFASAARERLAKVQML